MSGAAASEANGCGARRKPGGRRVRGEQGLHLGAYPVASGTTRLEQRRPSFDRGLEGRVEDVVDLRPEPRPALMPGAASS